MDRSLRKDFVILFCIIATVNFFCCTYASDEESFLQGNKYYEQGEYDNAINSYNKIQQKGRAVLYNMGNCYYYKQEYMHALVYWNKAEKGASYDEQIQIEYNKENLLKKLGYPIHTTWLQKIYNFFIYNAYFSLLFLQICFLCVWYLLLFFCKKSKRRKLMILTMLICCVMISVLLGTKYAHDITCRGIVVHEVPVFAGPHKEFHLLSSLPSMQEVTIQELRQGWYKVYAAHCSGWVEADAIAII